MFTCFWITISLSEAEIDNVNDILFFAVPNKEVIRFHVPVNEMVIVQELESLDHLVCDHERGLDCEFALAEIESVFETGTEEIHDHCVVVALDSKPVDSRNASCNDETIMSNTALTKSNSSYTYRLHSKSCRFWSHKATMGILSLQVPNIFKK